MGFRNTKDRIWIVFDWTAALLARQSKPVRRVAYSIFGAVLWIAYSIPRSTVRDTFEALGKHAGAHSTWRLFRNYVQGFLRGVDRIEQVRHGRTDAIDAMLRIPQQERLDELLQQGGVILVIPHTHASLAMGRGLARRYPLLALVRSTVNKHRAASEREIYTNLGCEFLDIRLENPIKVARDVLNALNGGRLVVATADRTSKAPEPEAPINSSNDIVRALAFDQAIGIAGWPGRFSWKAKVPIIPATVVQSKNSITLQLGNEIAPTADLIQTTQKWVDELMLLITSHPEEWTFALDKNWSRALRNSQMGRLESEGEIVSVRDLSG